MNLNDIIDKLQIAFKNDEVKKQILDTYWLNMNIQTGINSTGFCFSASEVIYRLCGGKENWIMKSIIDPRDWNNGTHYFLVNKQSQEILDVTSEQYTLRGIEIPYHLGKGKGLRNVSKKARLLAELAELDNI